jgi:hypothetical protein
MMPPLSVPAGAETRERWQTREAIAAVPDRSRTTPTTTARVAPAAVARVTTTVPETTRTTLVVVA